MYNDFLQDPFLRHLFIAMVILAGSVLAGRILRSLLDVLFRLFIQKTRTTLDDRIHKVLRAKVIPLSIIVGSFVGIGEVRKGLTNTDLAQHQLLEYLSMGMYVVVALTVVHLLTRLLRAIIEWYGETVSERHQADIAPAITPVATKIVNIVLYFFGGLVILDHVGVNIGGLLVSLGVGSLAIALAAQETIANVIGWFVILLDQPLRTGDVIRLPSGEEGRVHHIGLRATRIVNYDNNMIVVPNGELAKTRIVNFSMPDAVTRVVVDCVLEYGTELEKARSVMLAAVAGMAHVAAEPAPEVYCINLTESGIHLRVMLQTPLDKKFEVETRLRSLLYRSLMSAGIQFAVPKRTIHLTPTHAT